MKLHGEIDIHVQGEQVLRQPKLWDKLKQLFGGEPDLTTDRVRASLESTAIVDAVRHGLASIGANNAVSLVIDDQVLFHDRERRPDDLGDLFLAFHEHAPVFGAEFSVLRLAVEHEEAGLHMVLEVIARSEHAQDEPAARIVLSGRVRALEPRPGESAEAYRQRVEPLTRDPMTYQLHKLQLESFVQRVRDAMATAMPEARLSVRSADAQVVKPTRARGAAELPPPLPTERRYDPYDAYYPNPMGAVLTAMVWGSIFSMATPPGITVVNQSGTPLGTADELAAQGGEAAAEAADASASAAEVPMEQDLGGDDTGLGGDDLGGDDLGGDLFGDW